LQKLARHSEISITLKYYTTLDAEDIAEELWAGFGQKTDNNTAIYNKPYNTCPQSGENESGANRHNPLCSKVAEAGLENSVKLPGKQGDVIKSGAKSGPRDSIDAQTKPDPALSLLTNAWPFLSLAERKAILAIVRQVSTKVSK
jgi:hypothetical protein